MIIVFQSIFLLEMHQNNIFLFFILTYQNDPKTIKNNN